MIYDGKYKLVFILLVAAYAVFGCTIAVISGDITPDGRPILWKNRDVSNADQEFVYDNIGRYAHVTNIYNGGTTKAWGGVNETGFGIMNSDTYNNGSNRRSGPDDGFVMKWGLKWCRTIDDFEAFLDSTNVTGRRSCHNYGVCDAYGGCAIFETSNNSYVRFDASDDPNGFLVRANYAYSGSSSHHGWERHDRAMEIMLRQGEIGFEFMFDSVASNLSNVYVDPYPLPFYDIESPYPSGYVSTHATINRYYTTSVEIIIGKHETDEDREYPVLWGMLGQPVLSLPFPLYPLAHGVDPLLDGVSGSKICDYGRELKTFVYDMGVSHYLNTYTAKEIVDYHIEPKQAIFDRYNTRMRDFMSTHTSVEQLRAFQDSMTHVVDDIYSFGTAVLINEVILSSNPVEIGIFASPNPFNSTVEISLLNCPDDLDITIYDTIGRPVKIIGKPDFKYISGSFKWTPEPSLPSGIYYVRVLSDRFGNNTLKLLYIK